MKIAILGTRGIPANYGGFETFAEELSYRLAERGYDVTVYGRKNWIKYSEETYRGVNIRLLPSVTSKYFDTVLHTFLSSFDVWGKGYDAVLMVNSANAFVAWIPRLAGIPVALNVDGIEWQRGKWGFLGKTWYKFGEFLATFSPTVVVSDALVIQRYYLEKFNKKSKVIPYGSNSVREEATEVLEKYKLEPRRYLLYVSRLERENNAHIVMQAYQKLDTDMPLVVVGWSPYAKDYIEELQVLAAQDSRIIMTGGVYGQGYREFQSHAYAYIQATEVGGTHPALVEALGYGNCVLANGTPENIEVVADSAFIYEKNNIEDLARQLQILIETPELAQTYREKAYDYALTTFSWDVVTDQYEDLFKALIAPKKD